MRYLGIDLGSSFIKGAVLNLDDPSVSHVERLNAPALVTGLDPRFRETDPGTVVQSVQTMLERLHAHAPDAAGVLMCSQLHGMVLCDDHGRPQSRYINWQDQRALLPLPGSDTNCFEEIESLVSPLQRQQLGNERIPGVPLNYLFWFLRNRALPEMVTTPASLPYFVAAQLCGTTPLSDITHAYGHGALNIHSLDWHQGVLETLGLNGLKWPRIVAQGAVVGEWSHAGRSLPFFAPVGDYHCSQVGALLEEGELSVNISTGSAVIQIANGTETGDFQTRPWFDGRYLKTITHIPGGRALNALVKLLTELAAAQGLPLRDPWEYIHCETGRADGGELAVNPAFYPGSMGNRGAIISLREENMTVGNLFRATFEGMAANYTACAARITPQGGWKRLVFSGGVAMKNETLRQLICARLGQAHRLAPSPEDTLFGLLVLSLAFSGKTRSVADAITSVRNHLSLQH